MLMARQSSTSGMPARYRFGSRLLPTRVILLPMMRSLAAAVLLSGVLVAAPLTSTASADAPAFHSGDGLTLVSATQSDARTWHLVVSTPALSQPVRVNVLLPVGYADTTTSYPVLYLLHGTSGGADDWLASGNAEALTAPYPMIVVMPDGGYRNDGGSWYTNWVDQQTKLGASNWEAFHIGELVPWTDDNLRTIANRSARAIAGLSMGGFGSFSYAARHPDMFASAGSFSGAPDIASNPIVLAGANGIIQATAVGLDGVEPYAMFGDPALYNINWRGHNPASLVTNLSDTALDLWSGNGVPGPLDTPSAHIVQDALVEGAAHESSVSFTQVARRAHIAYFFDNYGNGTHSWPYWTRDLSQYLPAVMATFDSPAPPPSAITYRSIDKSWTQWGWTVANVRTKRWAFSGLVGASASGFTITSGSSTRVTTPPLFAPGDQYRIATIGGSAPKTVAVSITGQLTVPVTPALAHYAVQVTLTRI
jgi:S-formylglutathione hydrolase FrmB